MNIIWNIRRPASSEKEKVSEEVLVGFAAESWRCPRPRDTWWVATLPLPWFSTMVTYINKKLSDCLVGVFGVDSEKENLFNHLGIEEKAQPGNDRSIKQEKEGVGEG